MAFYLCHSEAIGVTDVTDRHRARMVLVVTDGTNDPVWVCVVSLILKREGGVAD